MTPEVKPLTAVEKPQEQGIVEPKMTNGEKQETQSQVTSAHQHLYSNYAQPNLVMDHGQGSQLWDTDGKRYIDFFAGIAVSCLGHAHPQLTRALSEQASRLIHLSNYFYTGPNIELAEKLCALTGMQRALFCNSGTEANEAALKLTRRYFFDQGKKDRDIVIAFDNSFHGRTMGSLAVTGQPKYRVGFGPIGGAVHTPFGDLEKVARLLDDTVAGIIVEPLQGEGGVVPAPEGFLAGLRDLCDKSGALLIADEIQTGIGRTGKFLAVEHDNVKPDVVTLAKALGGGVPIGVMLCTENLSQVLAPGSHGSTFGGNPLASAAALAVLDVLKTEALVERAASLGARLESELDKLVKKHGCLSTRRGKGLLQGLLLTQTDQGGCLLKALRDAGLLLTFAGGVALRITPPLNITDSELDEGLQILDLVLGDFA